MDENALWDRLLLNTCLWVGKDCELLKTFRDLREQGAKLELKTVREKHTKQPIQRLFLRRGKISADDWDLTRVLKLEPYREEIAFIFEVVVLGAGTVQLAKPISEETIAKAICKYLCEIVNAKEKAEEFTVQVGDKELTVVPKRTNRNRTEVTIEELYVLKHLQEEGVIKTPEEAQKWVQWK